MAGQDEFIAIPMGMGMGGGVPQAQKQDKSDLLEKIKPDLMVEVIRHKLLGEELIGGKWVKQAYLKDRALTEIGAWEISNLMLGVSSINVSISKLDDKEIKERLLRIAKSAQYMLVSNWKEYGLRNVSQQWYVHEIVFSNTLAVLKQADDASIQELIKGTVTENRNIQSEPKREGRLKRMLGMG